MVANYNLNITPVHLGGHNNITHIDEGVFHCIQLRFNIQTMIDVGCGVGGMIRVAQNNGVSANGIDGDPSVLILSGLPFGKIITHDFYDGPLRINKQFDLAWSVEFLEHVEEQFSNNYMQLFQSCRYVFCTAAPPGTPGFHHVNCQPQSFWIDKFEKYGFKHDEVQNGVQNFPGSWGKER